MIEYIYNLIVNFAYFHPHNLYLNCISYNPNLQLKNITSCSNGFEDNHETLKYGHP